MYVLLLYLLHVFPNKCSGTTVFYFCVPNLKIVKTGHGLPVSNEWNSLSNCSANEVPFNFDRWPVYCFRHVMNLSKLIFYKNNLSAYNMVQIISNTNYPQIIHQWQIIYAELIIIFVLIQAMFTSDFAIKRYYCYINCDESQKRYISNIKSVKFINWVCYVNYIT